MATATDGSWLTALVDWSVSLMEVIGPAGAGLAIALAPEESSSTLARAIIAATPRRPGRPVFKLCCALRLSPGSAAPAIAAGDLHVID